MMGIPGMKTWLIRRYPQAFQPFDGRGSYDHVYIDFASILHTVTRKGM